MSSTIEPKRVLVTGGRGFLGRYLVRELVRLGYQVYAPSKKAVNWTSRKQARMVIRDYQPDEVYHLAGYNGDIQFNQKFAGTIFHRNTAMGLNVLDACREYGVPRVLSVIASCAYPTETSLLTPDCLLKGEPHPSVEGHAYAKRNLVVMSRLYNQQFGCNFGTVCPPTLFGPPCARPNSKVMDQLIYKFWTAKREGFPAVQLLGNGAPHRQVLYVEDCPRLLWQAMWDPSTFKETCHIAGHEKTVRELAEMVCEAVQYKGEIHWNGSVDMNGQMRKNLVAGPEYGPATSLEEGIRKTLASLEAA